MKGFLLIILSFISVCSFCQEQTDEDTIKCSVIVKQSFHGWTHCHRNPKPRWHSSSIKEINKETVAFESGDDEIILQDIEIKRYDEQESFRYEFASNNVKLEYTLDVANIKEEGHYGSTISRAYNKLEIFEDGNDAHCLMKKDEGYSFSLSFIIDDPIYLMRKNGNNKCFVIEDKEKLEVSFNDFYENNEPDRIFQYRIKDGKWTDFNKSFNDRVSISPKGSVKIGYEDIFGNDPQDSVYLNGSGKSIQIRVLKTLSGEKKIKTPSNVILARFYHRGPTFTVENVRWPACNDSVEVHVNIDSESLKHVKSLKGKYKWEAAHFPPGKNSSDHSFDVFYSPTSILNRYKLLLVDQKDSCMDYLSRDDAQTGKFKLQLQLKDENGDDITGLAFCTQEFTIPQKLDTIKSVQSDGYLFELDGKKYHLFNKNEPYVVLNITDDDHSELGRMPYKIYNKKDSLLAEITGKIKIDEEKIEKERDSIYVELEKGRNAFDKQCAEEWYNKNQNNDTVKLFTHNSIYLENVGMVSGICAVEDDGFTYLYSSGNVYLKIQGIWGATTYGYKYYYESSNDSYKFENIYGNYKIWHNGNIVDISPKVGYAFVVGNARYLLLSQPKTQVSTEKYFYLYDLTSSGPEQFNSVCSEFQSDLSGGYQLFLYGGDEIIALKNKNIHTYTIKRSQQGIDLEKKSEPKTTIKAPASPSKILIGENSISYTAIDGKSYEEYYKVPEKTTFITKFDIEKSTLFTSLKFDDRWKLKKERCWKQYYLQHYGYHIHGIETNKDEELTLIDNDGCPYTIPYRVNVLDGLKIDEVAKSNPKLGNSADGTAELKVTPGGTEDYYYNGEKIKGPKTINLSGLKWGANEVVFTDEKWSTIKTHIVNLTPQVTATSNAQTCAEANGSIVVSGSDTKTEWRCYNSKVEPIDYTKLTGLKAGQYVVQGIYGGNWINVDTIEVEDKIFSASFVSKNDAPTIGGKGTAIIKVRNVDGNLSWFEGDEKIDDCSYNAQNSIATVPLSKGTHVIVASDNKNCPSAEEKVTIGGPVMTNAEVVVENENGNVRVTLSAGFENVTKRNLVLYNQQNEIVASSQNNELQLDSASVKLNDVYSLDLQYEVDGKSGITQTLNLFEDLTPLRLTTATQYTADTLRCYGTKDTVKVAIDEKNSNIGDKVEYKIGSSKWKTLSSDGKNEEVDADNCSITYMTDTTEVEDFVKVVNRATYTKELTIKPGKKYDHDVEFNDVVCLGKDKGSIVLTPDSSRTIESVWLRKDNVDYKSGVISGLEAGTYTIKVVDGLCPSKEDVRTGTISAPQKELKITKSTIIIDPTCHEKDGVIELEVSGGWGGYRKITDLDEYNKDNEFYLEKVIASDNGILRFDSISSGKRDFTIVDEGLCVLTYSIEIPEYKNPYITKAELDATSCYGTSDGRIEKISVQTNSSKVCVDSIYIDNGIDITGKTYDTNVENLAAGNYKLWLVDDNGCKTDANKVYSISIEQPAPLTLTVTKEADVSSYGESDAVIKVSAEGGNNCDKKIYVKKRDVEGNDVQIDEENFEFEKINEKFFIGEAATRSSDHNIVKYNFGKGIYTFQVRDVLNDCPSNIVDNIIVESPSEPLSAQITTHQALCHNETGFVEITPTGGWGAPYTIEFNNIPYQATQGKPIVKVDQLESGRYLVTIRDSKARAVYKDYADVPLPNDSISFGKGTFFSAETCSENGNAHIEIVGGSGSYPKITYNNKNFGTDIFDINNLKAGHYSVIIEDSNECEATLEFEIEDNKLTAKVQSYNTIDGGATLKAVVNGGIEPYRYEWSREDGQLNGVNKGEIIDRLEHGIYAVKVTDASGCDAASESNVLTDGDKAMNVVLLQRETSENASDGFVVLQSDTTIFVSKVLYHVHNGATDSINIDNEFIGDRLRIDGLAGGTYFVKCMLSNGIMRMSPRFEIKPYQRLKIDNIDVRHVTQPHLVDGQAKIILEGGIPPFVVTATNTTNPTCEPTKIISDVLSFDMDALIAGEYALNIVDSTNNVVDSAFIVEEPDELTLLAEVSPTLCHDDPSGEVKLTATGGWGKFMFEYADNGYKKQNEYLRLSSGLQKFKVIDRYGTTKSIDVVIEQPDEVRIQSAKVDSVDCFGRNTGKITFGVTGGNSAYTIWYSEKDGNKILYSKNDTILSDRYKGTYIVTFTDGNGCKSPDTISIYIPEPDLLELANDYVTHTTCELDNGKIAIEVKGGSLPYIYEWKENGATYSGAKTVNMVRNEAENLKQNASYHIDITDSHGCTTQYEKLIEHSENPRVLGVATTDVLCYGSSDGIATVDPARVKMGKPEANYYLTWPQGQTGVMSVNTLPTGTYTVRITDDNNCTTTTDFTIGTPQPVKNHLAGLRDALCFGYSDGRIETHTTGGVGDYTYVWNTGETTSYADSLKAGLYTIVVTDSHECKDSATYEVTEPEELKINLGDDVLICPGNIHVFDAGEYATYSWRSVASGEEIETERFFATGDEGDYAIKVTNEIGCIARDTVNMAIGENALEAEFLMASDAAVNDTIMLIRLSNMPVDSVRWQYDKLVTVDVEDAEDYMFPLMAESTGRYYITMWAYSGGCESFEQKYIDIYEAVEDSSNFKIGYDPLIKQAKVSPNPNDGEFSLIVVLREKADVDVMVHDVNNGRQVEQVVLKDSDKYNTRLNIRQWGSGIFVLSIVSGSERRAIKVLCVR